MSISVEKFKVKAEGKLHGRTLNKVADVEGKIGESAGNVLLRIDPFTTIRRVRIENAIFDQVYNYTAPSDIKGNDKIIDIRPIGERSQGDGIRGVHTREFDIRKEGNTASIEVINGVKTLKLSKELTARTVLHRCDSLTLEGTVTGGGDIENLTTNTLEYISGTGSIQFGLSGATGSATLAFALNNSLDLSDMKDVGALFHWLRLADASRISSVELRWGSDDSNYWSKTITSPHDRSAFENSAFNLARYDWEGAGETGSPDATAIDYLLVTINYTAGTAIANNFIENFTAAKGQAWEIVYYSNCLFTSADGLTWKEEPDADTDLVMLDNDGVNILLYEWQKIASNEVKGKNMSADFQAAELMLEGNQQKPGLYDLFERKYPSQAVVFQSTYHDFDNLND